MTDNGRKKRSRKREETKQSEKTGRRKKCIKKNKRKEGRNQEAIRSQKENPFLALCYLTNEEKGRRNMKKTRNVKYYLTNN
ncbi:hypothetical protein RCL_jg4818.t1 [Rhizophagus clarus]|uniref:Uncharacterized protein n=1 Tax=Rhizophagus clarus TaxID=94130 RepID=A0A8H3MCI3_9GLOM|nr:hypothetical protein RCL_jg4818.t1 [Rhizophagus clarus]